MLRIVTPGIELWDERERVFIDLDPVTLELEHSLVSLSKWESEFQKPFLSSGTEKKTAEEILRYVYHMIITPNVSEITVKRLSQVNLDDINNYIESPQSATTFGEMPKTHGRGEVITSELIYYWMVAFNIPFECERWHLNRLFSLIRICNIKNSKPTKMSRNEIVERNRKLNEQRRKELGTKG